MFSRVAILPTNQTGRSNDMSDDADNSTEVAEPKPWEQFAAKKPWELFKPSSFTLKQDSGTPSDQSFDIPNGNPLLTKAQGLKNLSDAASTVLTTSPLDKVLPEARVKPDDSKTMAVGKEAYNLLAGIPKFATSGAGMLTAPIAAAKPVATSLAFSADMVKNLGETIYSSYKDWDKMTGSQKAAAITDMVGTGAFAGLIGVGAAKGLKGGEDNAIQVGKTTPLSVGGTPGDSGKVGEGIPTPEKSPETPPPETVGKGESGIQAPDEVKPIPPAAAVATPTPVLDANLTKTANAPADVHGGAEEDLPAAQQAKSKAGNDPAAWGQMIAATEAAKKQSQGNGLPSPENTKNEPVPPINEPAVPAQSPTSIKNEVVDQEREARGLPAAVEPAKRSFGKVWEDAEKRMQQDPAAASDLVKELREKPRAITDTEDAMLLRRQIDLQNEHAKVAADLIKASDEGRTEDVQENKIRQARLSDDLLDLYNVNKTVGTESGRGLNARRMMANEDYSLAGMETRLRSAKGGDKLSDAESKNVKDIADKVLTTGKAVDDYQKSMESDSTQPKYSDFVLSVANKIVAKLDERADAARVRIRERSGRLSAGIDPTLLLDYAEIGASHIAHVGLDFAKWSAEMLKEFKGLKGEDLKSIYAASQKRADGVSDELAPKNQEVKQAVKKQPSGNPKLQAAKTRLANRTEELKAKSAAGDFSKKVRTPLKLDPEAIKLKAAYEDAKLAFDRLEAKERLKNRGFLEKTQDTFVKWRRAFLLSSPSTLAKLTSAAFERLAFTPIEEVVGGVYSKIPGISKVAARAPREGGLNVSAEARAITEGFTKGMSDAYKTLTTGHSDIDSIYGKRDVLPRSAIEFIGSIHGALKAPVKRAEFARSFEKRVAFAIKNGQDVTDPLIQSKIAIAAFRDAQKSIFMQDNKVTAAWQAGLRILQSPNKETGKVSGGAKAIASAAQTMLPIVKIPTNIVAETLQYAVGSVTGSVRLGVALAKGMENLKPEEADLIMRELKKGSLGSALLVYGYLNPQTFGGYYQMNDKAQKGHPKFGTVQIGGWNVPSMLVHNPLLETLQIGATVRHVADAKLRKKDNETQGLSSGILAAALGLTDEVPFVNQVTQMAEVMNPYERGKYLDQFARDMIVPLGVQWVAQHFDKDAKGNYILRDPKGFKQTIESAIPLLREKVPQKQAKAAPLRPKGLSLGMTGLNHP
jgi:hypothetical protein